MNTTSGNGPPPSEGYEMVVGMRRELEPGYAPNASVGRDVSTNVTWRVPTACLTPIGIGVSGPGGGGGGGKHPAASTAATTTPDAATSTRRRGRERKVVGGDTTLPGYRALQQQGSDQTVGCGVVVGEAVFHQLIDRHRGDPVIRRELLQVRGSSR